jgi:hypothetical protein
MDDKFRGYSSACLLQQEAKDFDMGKDITCNDILRYRRQLERDSLEGILKMQNPIPADYGISVFTPPTFRPFAFGEGCREENEIRIRVKRRKLKFNFNN